MSRGNIVVLRIGMMLVGFFLPYALGAAWPHQANFWNWLGGSIFGIAVGALVLQ